MLGQIFAVVSACGLFVGGHQFLKHYLCKGTHHEIDSLVTTLFSASFSLSSGLLLLVLYEILGKRFVRPKSVWMKKLTKTRLLESYQICSVLDLKTFQ